MLIILMIGCARESGAQIDGVVVDSDKLPIEAVYIMNLNTGDHVHSDAMGYFRFQKASPGDTLLLRHLSYETSRFLANISGKQLTCIMKRKAVSIEEIVIQPSIDALNMFTDIDTRIDPVNSSQDILTAVPGLFIGQHAGGGKAEQIFLRGFDIDHGTDIDIRVDGMPVNMVSHAHGQGYADLHFLIPETVDDIDFGKGPYYAEKGNFNTAGFVSFNTKDRLRHNYLKTQIGGFDYRRLLAMVKIMDKPQETAYLASEWINSNGPFESPQDFIRVNLFGKYSGSLSDKDKFTVAASHFTSNWDASGQIPQRSVDAGIITRFGAIDDTEGGETSRSHINLEYKRMLEREGFILSNFYFIDYDFELYSNFTFYLNDPEYGDQIRQKEARQILGFNSQYRKALDIGSFKGSIGFGGGVRFDQVSDIELSNTINRQVTQETVQFGDVTESNPYLYVESHLGFKNWNINPSIRIDNFNQSYRDLTRGDYLKLSRTGTTLSPVLNIVYNQSSELQYFLKAGKGFHSNDTRVVTGDIFDRSALPSAYGSDLGIIWKPLKSLIMNSAIWLLFIEEEFVYVGDAGIVEPSGATKRYGLDFSVRYQPASWFVWLFDSNFAVSRFLDKPEHASNIPLAPKFTIKSAVYITSSSGFRTGIKFRHMADRPADESGSLTAQGYSIVDLNMSYDWHNLEFGISVDNLLNSEWNETQFATKSRLASEQLPVEEIHFTPGFPRFMRASIAIKFR